MPHTGDEKRGYWGDTPHTPDLLRRPMLDSHICHACRRARRISETDGRLPYMRPVKNTDAQDLRIPLIH